MSLFEKIELPEVKNIIVVASGKGGVGKSTVATNISVKLAERGVKTALVDADIYGPSIPRMMGVENKNPEISLHGEKEMMHPILNYGVKIMSVGFFVSANQGLIWRGPVVSNVIRQLLENTIWGGVDYMIIDLPPGTGDIQLTLIQKLNINACVLVTTPQEIALNDARKAASMFCNQTLNVPIVGVVENMAWFTPKPHPEEKYYIFGQGGGQKLAQELNTEMIAQIPLIAELGENAENGCCNLNSSNLLVDAAFEKIVDRLLEKCSCTATHSGLGAGDSVNPICQ